MDESFTFTDADGSYGYVLRFSDSKPTYVFIMSCFGGLQNTGHGWWHSIKNGEIVWRIDNWLPMSDDAKRYFSKIVKLRAFI